MKIHARSQRFSRGEDPKSVLSSSSNIGFTMIEILIVLTILALMAIFLALVIPRLLSRSQDAARKTHLEKYRVALEEFYSDKGYYPDETLLQNCNSGDLSPYLPAVYCDPTRDEPYYYVRNVDGTAYALYAELTDDNDPVITERGCQSGCGPDLDSDGAGDFNTGVSSGQVVTGGGDSPTPPPGGGGSPIPPQCGTGQNLWCVANACSICCPGTYRCSPDASQCIPDASCNP